MWAVGSEIKIRLSSSSTGEFLVKNVIFLTNEDEAETSSSLRRLQAPRTGSMIVVTAVFTLLGLMVGLGLGTWRRGHCLPSLVTMRRHPGDTQPIIESPSLTEPETTGSCICHLQFS